MISFPSSRRVVPGLRIECLSSGYLRPDRTSRYHSGYTSYANPREILMDIQYCLVSSDRIVLGPLICYGDELVVIYVECNKTFSPMTVEEWRSRVSATYEVREGTCFLRYMRHPVGDVRAFHLRLYFSGFERSSGGKTYTTNRQDYATCFGFAKDAFLRLL